MLEAEPSRFPMESRLSVDSGVVGGGNDLAVADEAFVPVPEGFDPWGEIPSGGGLCLFGDFFVGERSGDPSACLPGEGCGTPTAPLTGGGGGGGGGGRRGGGCLISP